MIDRIQKFCDSSDYLIDFFYPNWEFKSKIGRLFHCLVYVPFLAIYLFLSIFRLIFATILIALGSLLNYIKNG